MSSCIARDLRPSHPRYPRLACPGWFSGTVMREISAIIAMPRSGACTLHRERLRLPHTAHMVHSVQPLPSTPLLVRLLQPTPPHPTRLLGDVTFKARRRVHRLRGRRRRGACARAALHVQRVCRGFVGRRRAAARKKAAKLDIWWAARQG